MSAHTPGPWSWREMADRHYNVEVRLGSVALAFDENTANGAATGVIGDEAEANARLIAAAPDLVAHIEREHDISNSGGPNWAMRITNEFGRDYRAAIKKARGNNV